MKKFLLLSLAALSVISASHAVTPEEFVNKGKVWRSQRYDPRTSGGQLVPSYVEGDLSLRTLADQGYPNWLVISNMVDANALPSYKDIVMAVEFNRNNSVSIADAIGTDNFNTDGINQGYARCRFLKYTLVSGTLNDGIFLIPVGTTANGLVYKDDFLTGNIEEKADGNYKLTFGPYRLIKAYRTYGLIDQYRYDASYVGAGYAYYYVITESQFIGGLEYQTYVPNATITDTRNYLQNQNLNNYVKTENRSYTAYARVGETSIDFVNFGNYGIANSIKTSGGSFIEPTSGLASAKYDLNTMTFNIGQHSTMARPYNNLVATQYVYAGNYNTYQKIGGTIEKGDIFHYGDSRWIDGETNGTAYKTILKVNDYVTDFETTSSWYYDSKITNTVIEINDKGLFDYTHGLSIAKNEFGYSSIRANDDDVYVYVNFDLVGHNNVDHVESYEIYIVPNVSEVNDHTDFQHENGHAKGYRIDRDEYNTNFKGENNVRTHGLYSDEEQGTPNHYQLLIPEKDIIGYNSGSEKYALYVKTIYTDESGLEPTFHALTALGDTTTGVEGIINNGETNDEDAPVMYYNMNGVQMDGNNLMPGVYIRRQGSSTSKVIIR